VTNAGRCCLSTTTHDVGTTDGSGDDITGVLRVDVDAAFAPVTAFDPSVGDDWGSVLALSALVICLIVVVLLLGGGG